MCSPGELFLELSYILSSKVGEWELQYLLVGFNSLKFYSIRVHFYAKNGFKYYQQKEIPIEVSYQIRNEQFNTMYLKAKI